MKKEFLIIGCISAVCLLQGCSKETVKTLPGTYSYKNSGSLSITLPEKYEPTEQSSVSINEIGTMDIRAVEKKDSLLIIFNPSGRGLEQCIGKYKDDKIVIEPFVRSMDVNVDTLMTPPTELIQDKIKVTVKDHVDMTVTGEGSIYEDMIVFNLNYKGIADKTGAIVESQDTKTVAKKN